VHDHEALQDLASALQDFINEKVIRLDQAKRIAEQAVPTAYEPKGQMLHELHKWFPNQLMPSWVEMHTITRRVELNRHQLLHIWNHVISTHSAVIEGVQRSLQVGADADGCKSTGTCIAIDLSKLAMPERSHIVTVALILIKACDTLRRPTSVLAFGGDIVYVIKQGAQLVHVFRSIEYLTEVIRSYRAVGPCSSTEARTHRVISGHASERYLSYKYALGSQRNIALFRSEEYASNYRRIQFTSNPTRLRTLRRVGGKQLKLLHRY
jgi:hypothetical protein